MMPLLTNPHIANEVTHSQLMHRARQIRKVCTNPASFKQDSLNDDMPIIGEFTD